VLTSSEQSYSQGLTTIGRAATISDADNFTDEGNPRIWFSNPGGFKLRFILEPYGGGSAYATRDVTNPSSPYTFSLTTAERNAMRSAATTSKSLSIGVVIQTFLSSSAPSNPVYVQQTLTITQIQVFQVRSFHIKTQIQVLLQLPAITNKSCKIKQVCRLALLRQLL
jgi:hypothetical protein